jgi:hypothetical protein
MGTDYERFKTVKTKEEYFNKWNQALLEDITEQVKENIYKRYVVKSMVFQRDEFKCQNENCKSKDLKITLHHIKFQKNNGEDKPKNCITICRDCHRNFHKGKIPLTFWGMTYQIHVDQTPNRKQLKWDGKQTRKQYKELHGVRISWEMMRLLMQFLFREEYGDYEDDD